MRFDQHIEVRFSYPVYFERELFSTENPTIRNVIAHEASHLPKKVLVVVDEGVHDTHPELIDGIKAYFTKHRDVIRTTDILIMPGGEEAKNNPRHVDQLLHFIEHNNLCRHSFVMAIGGGALLDVVGYAAAIAHRGIPLIRVPTTVLAQNDSGVGVKNGYNKYNKKNFIGTFAPPAAVLCDAGFLTTLSERDWRSGISEAIKVALLGDADFFFWIEHHTEQLINRNLAVMDELNQRCAKLHLDHIANNGDPFEFGMSRPLDFGHWSAHRLEYLSDYELRHGEAVAIGIALDAVYSYLEGMLSKDACECILFCIRQLGFALTTNQLVHLIDSKSGVLCGLEEFREHIGGKLTIMLLADIGKGVEVHQINKETYKKSVRLLHTYEQTGKLEA